MFADDQAKYGAIPIYFHGVAQAGAKLKQFADKVGLELHNHCRGLDLLQLDDHALFRSWPRGNLLEFPYSFLLRASRN